jgi:type I restriction enzyme S subunit
MSETSEKKRGKIKSLDATSLPLLPKQWSWATLNDLAAREPHSITDGPFGSNLKTSHYTDTGPRVIRLQNIGDGFFLDGYAHISEAHFDSLKRHEIIAGDLAIAALGETLPRSCVVPTWVGPAIVKADCPRFRPNFRVVLSEFVNYALNSPDTRRRTSGIIHGVGRPRLNLAEVRGIWLPVAPLNEQRRIVAKIEELFSDLDAGVAALKRAKANLKRYRAAVLKAAVEGKLTEELTHQAFDKSCWLEIGTVLTCLEQGWSPKCEREAATTHSEWAVMKTSAVLPMMFLEDENKRLPDLLTPEPELAVQPNDLLITRAGPRNRAAVTCFVRSCRPRLIVCDKVYRMRCNPKSATPGFLEVVLNSPPIVDDLDELKTGISDSGVNLTQERFRRLRIPLPPIEIQERIVAEIDERFSVIAVSEQQIEVNLVRAARLRQSILKQAFEGKLVPQDPQDEPASVLLERLRASRSAQEGNGKAVTPARARGRRAKSKQMEGADE